MADDQTALFDAAPYVEAPAAEPEQPKLGADARRTIRQAAMLARGTHPLAATAGHLALHPEAAPADDRTAPGRRCGSCWYRRVLEYHTRSYAKCVYGATNPTDADPHPGPPPRASHSAASDVRGWWPGCRDHSYAETSMSDDAARWVPEAADA